MIAAFRSLAARHPRLLLMLVPRKPERFDTAARKLDEAGIPFLRRSQPGRGRHAAASRRAAARHHRRVERPVRPGGCGVHGRHAGARGADTTSWSPRYSAGPSSWVRTWRISARSPEEFARGAAVEIASPAELAPAVAALLDDRTRAAETAAARSPAPKRAAAPRRAPWRRSASFLPRRFPCLRPPLPQLLLFWPLALLWRWGGDLRRARGMARRRSAARRP